MRRPWPAALLLVLGLLFPERGEEGRAAQDDSPSVEETGAAIVALRADLELERVRLDRDLSDYASNEARREELRDQISVLYARLAVTVRRGETPEEEEGMLEALDSEAQAAEQAEEAVRATLRRLRERISDSRQKIRFLERKLAELRRSQPTEVDNLTGTWDVSYLPSGDRGVFTLRQSGTLISGEYTQEGGWKGSLQGTLVNNKLVLHRIDSKLGPASDLEAVVSADLKSVKGTWQSRVLSDGTASSGAWTGRKRESRKKTEGGPP